MLKSPPISFLKHIHFIDKIKLILYLRIRNFITHLTIVYVVVSWSKTEDIKFSFASSNIIGAIFFAFLSTFAWVDIL